MTEDRRPADSDPDHEKRVQGAFDSFSSRVDAKLDDDARASVENLRRAASERDTDTLRRHLVDMRDRHGWLYRELAEHPEIANLLDELALLGL